VRRPRKLRANHERREATTTATAATGAAEPSSRADKEGLRQRAAATATAEDEAMSGKETMTQAPPIERPDPGGGYEKRGYDRLPQPPPAPAYDKLKPPPPPPEKKR
jgi:hypothetical protein